MSKYVIENVELIKKTYIVDAYSLPAAKKAVKTQAPIKVETLSEIPYNITTINEYEYDRFWKDTIQEQKDWVGPNLWIHEHFEPNRPNRSLDFLDPDIGPDQLKDDYPEDSFLDLEKSGPLWPPYEGKEND